MPGSMGGTVLLHNYNTWKTGTLQESRVEGLQYTPTRSDYHNYSLIVSAMARSFLHQAQLL